MAEEPLPFFRSTWTEEGIVVKAADELEAKGFGEKRGEEVLLKPYEAIYLLYAKKLAVLLEGKELSLDELVARSLKKDPDTWTKFLVYRDLRSRGYVAKDGFGFGVDFRVYDRGELGSKPAKYLVFALNEGTEMTVDELSKSLDEIKRMGKEPIVAVVERRGEAIYYRVSKAKFRRT